MTQKQIDLINAKIEKKKFEIEREKNFFNAIFCIAVPIMITFIVLFLQPHKKAMINLYIIYIDVLFLLAIIFIILLFFVMIRYIIRIGLKESKLRKLIDQKIKILKNKK